MRAGKQPDAIPHLLEGAREAIRRGAPQSAARSLRTSLHALEGSDAVNATLLLVEALQEQGRWHESLDILRALPADNRDNSEAFAFSALARGFLATPIDTWLECLPKLKSIVEGNHDITNRVRAARAIAHATANLRDRKLAADLLKAIDSIPHLELSIEARGHVGLAKSLLLFQAGEMEACFSLASAILAEMEGFGLASSVVVQLHAGLGAIRGRQGRYAEAVKLHEEALRLADVLGNDHLRTTTAANLAMCYGRLGYYEAQLSCALKARQEITPQPVRFTNIHIATSLAYGYAASGQVEQMQEAIEACERELTNCTPGDIAQSWLLWKADVLAVVGNHREAFQAGRRALEEYRYTLQARALAGACARWAALTSAGTEGHAKATNLLEELYDELEFHDALDQAEILAAKLYVSSGDQAQLRQRLQERLSALPQAALLPVRASGMLKDTDSRSADLP
jgi:tetratricopeptide (TPR) repeat protein